MRKLSKYVSLAATVLVLLLPIAAHFARATTIEGYTPAGTFQTVGVTTTGRLLIDISTQALSHVIVDSGTITVLAVISTGTVVSIATTSYVSQNMDSGQGDNTMLSNPFQLVTSSSIAEGTSICNDSDLIFSTPTVINIGGPAVSTSTGFRLRAGACFSPDNPSTYQGGVYGAALSSAAWSFIRILP